jgi:hypothetical protein
MPKKLTDREANDLINRRDEARKKSEYYANDAQHNKFLDKVRSKRFTATITQPDFKSSGDASTALANMYEQEAENLEIRRQPNSIQQYRHEREAGDPNALKLSFEDWKKL